MINLIYGGKSSQDNVPVYEKGHIYKYTTFDNIGKYTDKYLMCTVFNELKFMVDLFTGEAEHANHFCDADDNIVDITDKASFKIHINRNLRGQFPAKLNCDRYKVTETYIDADIFMIASSVGLDDTLYRVYLADGSMYLLEEDEHQHIRQDRKCTVNLCIED